MPHEFQQTRAIYEQSQDCISHTWSWSWADVGNIRTYQRLLDTFNISLEEGLNIWRAGTEVASELVSSDMLRHELDENEVGHEHMRTLEHFCDPCCSSRGPEWGCLCWRFHSDMWAISTVQLPTLYSWSYHCAHSIRACWESFMAHTWLSLRGCFLFRSSWENLWSTRQ